MRDNYQSAGLHIRKISDLPGGVEVIEEDAPFSIVRIPPPYVGGSEYWVVNEKGFLWEPAKSLEEARRYLEGAEATDYRAEAGRE